MLTEQKKKRKTHGHHLDVGFDTDDFSIQNERVRNDEEKKIVVVSLFDVSSVVEVRTVFDTSVI